MNIDGVRKFSLTDGQQFHLDEELENFASGIIAPSGDILVRTAGDTASLYTAAGELKWEFTVEGILLRDMSAAPDGGFLLLRTRLPENQGVADENDQPGTIRGSDPDLGRKQSQQGSDSDNELLALDGNGELRWRRSLGETPRHPVIVDSKGRLFLVVSNTALCLSGKDGSTVWSTEIPGLNSFDGIRSVAMDSQGRFIVSSSFKLCSFGD
ncbi:PQQ-binding-like beta-propeller repeat protein [bacterium]|nr:PQQ-binding-like beta-propeller repeat protein [bacterium]